MSAIYPLRQQWLGNIRGDLLSGIVVALALIPEAIAFSIIAGVDPKVGLYASFCIAVITAIAGGRPGMISAATGAMALVMVTLVKEHGVQLRRLPDDVINRLRDLSGPVIEASAQQDDLSRRVYASYMQFLKQVEAYHAVSEQAYINARTPPVSAPSGTTPATDAP